MQDKDGSTVHCFGGKHLIIDLIYNNIQLKYFLKMQTSTGVVAFGRNIYDIDGQTSNCLEHKNVVKGKQCEMLL